jgi:uncharacterized protein with FMN-binding domain
MALASPVLAVIAGCTRPASTDGAARPDHDASGVGDGQGATRPGVSGAVTVVPDNQSTTSIVTTTTTNLPDPPMAVASDAPAVPAGPAADAGKPRTVTGPVVSHQYGPVQVTVTVSGSRIVDVSATGPTGDPVSAAINGDALPKLNAAVLVAQSAQIESVSGATLTSPAYRASLQAALDSAGFGGEAGPGPAAPVTSPSTASPTTATPVPVSGPASPGVAPDSADVAPAPVTGRPSAPVPVIVEPRFTG